MQLLKLVLNWMMAQLAELGKRLLKNDPIATVSLSLHRTGIGVELDLGGLCFQLI